MFLHLLVHADYFSYFFFFVALLGEFALNIDFLRAFSLHELERLTVFLFFNL